MRNKLQVRKLIDNYKYKYSISKEKDLLLYIAILKGMYIALGGKKGIPLNINLDFIVKYSKIAFTYENKLLYNKNTAESRLKANWWLGEELRVNGKYIGNTVERFGNISTSNEIAALLTELICSEYTEDLFINSNKIYNIIIDVMDKTHIVKEDKSYG